MQTDEYSGLAQRSSQRVPRWTEVFATSATDRFATQTPHMIITIDGPAGAGKSSVSRQLAQRLGFAFLDTGAMYRCVTYAALVAGINFDNPDDLESIASETQIEFQGDRVFLNGEDVTSAIRAPEVTARIRYVADHPKVREHLSVHQRRIASQANTVTEGRDQGTEVFPDAECKIFLTASPEERARRRHKELTEAGKSVSVDEVLADQNRRDREDASRALGRLRPAEDAVVVMSDGLQPSEVVDRFVQIVHDRCKGEPAFLPRKQQQ